MSSSDTPGPLALVGSGEFLPAMVDTDALLLTGRAPTVAVIPTAAAPEGEASLRRWFGLAHDHYTGLAATVVEVDVRDRDHAEDPGRAALLDEVGMIYLSGGNPAFLAQTLRGTAVGAAITRRWREGVAVAGCSAGAMAMGATTLAVRGPAEQGLGLAGQIMVIPHFDRFSFAQRMVGGVAALRSGDAQLVGVDEDTAVVWHPDRGAWVVSGRSTVWLLSGTGGKEEGYTAGQEVPLPSPPGAAPQP